MDFNRVILIGRLGKDPIPVTTKTGTPMCILKLATSEMKKLENKGLVEQTEWHDIFVFGKIATNCIQYLSKGREVWIEGKLEYKNKLYKGVMVRESNILANTVGFLGKVFKETKTNAKEQTPVVDQVESTELPKEEIYEEPVESHLASIKLESSTTGKDPVNTAFSTLLERGLDEDIV